MRATRGFLGMFGASGSLTAAFACSLLVVSAIVGFQGWPGVSSTASFAPLGLSSSVSPRPGSLAGSAPGAATLVVAATPVTSRGAGGRSAGASGPGGGPSPTATNRRSISGPAVSASRPSPSSPTAGSESHSTSSPGLVGSATGTTGQAIQGAGSAAAGVTGQVSPSLAKSVDQAATGAGKTVTDAGKRVGALGP